MKTAYWIALILAVIGAINWGLVGLFQFDLVAALFGPGSPVSRLVYAVVGLAGLVLIGIAASEANARSHSTIGIPTR